MISTFFALHEVSFVYRGSAGSVALVSSFNQWDPNATALVPAGSGWHVKVYLPPGTYPYAFIVDGQLERDPDPLRALPGSLGSRYSVVTVPSPPLPARAA